MNVMTPPAMLPPPSSPAPAAAVGVACRGVEKEFGSGETRVRVLHGIDVDIACGALTLLVGPSGCGKTTLISIVAGLLAPSAGEVTLFGTPQSQLRGDRLVDFRARNVGFVFQQYNLLPALTAAENVAVPLFYQDVPKKIRRERAIASLELVGLGDRLGHRPSELSGGQQQRVAIARALVTHPVVLMADEPTGNLDSATGLAILKTFQRLHEGGMTLVMVTHDNSVARRCERVYRMRDGIEESDIRVAERDLFAKD
jgi:putative ABC transport system ATP-binding protein